VISERCNHDKLSAVKGTETVRSTVLTAGDEKVFASRLTIEIALENHSALIDRLISRGLF